MAHAEAAAHEGQEHPIGIYLQVWFYLFVLSTFSYLVDFWNIEGGMRWFLILFFMVLKAYLIMAVFMHLWWEAASLVYACVLPLLTVAWLIFLMVSQSDYTFFTRVFMFALGG